MPVRLTPSRRRAGSYRRQAVRRWPFTRGAGEDRTVTFPASPLGLRVRLALGADLTADPATWQWADFTDRARFDDGITVTTGRREQGAVVDAGTARLTFDNRDGYLTRRNPTSPYYGLLSINTPIWVTIDPGTGEYDLCKMFVNEWPRRWDRTQTDCVVRAKCSGPIRRLSRRKNEAAKSPLRRALERDSPSLWWPLEDRTDADLVSSGLAGGLTLGAAGVSFTGSLTPPGASAAADLSTTGVISGPTGLSGEVDSWEFEFNVGFSTLPTDNTQLYHLVTLWTAGSGIDWFSIWLYVSGTDVVPKIYWYNSTIGMVPPAVATDPLTAGQVSNLRLVATQDGADIDVMLSVDGVDSSLDGPTGVTLYQPSRIRIAALPETIVAAPAGFSAPYVTAWPMDSVSHAAIWTPARSTAETYLATNGNTGEQAHVRMARLCDEESVPFATVASTSVVCGPQRTAKFMDLMRDAEAVDLGVLFEVDWGFGYQSRSERENAAVVLTLDVDSSEPSQELEPEDSDQFIRNKWTASRTTGGEATVEETSGPLGTGAAGPGIYEDRVDVNVATDSQLPDQAGWRVRLGTVDEDRWPEVNLNFARPAVAAVIPTWVGLGFGPRMELTNLAAQEPPDPVSAFIEGRTERVTSLTWTAVAVTGQANPYDVGVLAATSGDDSDLLGYLSADVDALTLATAVDSTETSWSVNSDPLWTTVADDLSPGMLVWFGGEQVRVTACSGASSPQSWTVTRSVNGVVKAQTAGTVGELVDPLVLTM